MKWSFFHSLPLGRKFTLLCVAAVGLALLLCTMLFAFNQARVMRQARFEHLNLLAEAIADLSGAALNGSDRDGAADILDTLRIDRDIEAAAIYGTDGRLFAAYRGNDDAIRQLPSSLPSLSVESRRYAITIARPVMVGDRQLGSILLVADTGRMAAVFLNSLLLPLGGMVLVLAGTILVAGRLQALITRPVSTLALTARGIAERGEYSLRVKKYGDDEIGQLVDAFNTMLEGMEEREAELRQHRQNLETLVLERTEELRAKRDEALAAVRTKSEFLANMSHEIRTPMNGVVGVLSLLRDVPMGPEYRRLLETAMRSADSLLLIINDILDFSKIEAGKILFESIPFDLRQLLEEVSELFIDMVNLKDLEMTCFIPPELPCMVQGDPTRLRQILTNLLSNAVKFTEQGEIRLQVKAIRRQDNGQELLFTVEDTGIGIDEEGIGRLFDTFTQADGSISRKYGGTGLGLSVCKQLVEQQGGSIGASSTPGAGSCFWFSLVLDIVEETFPLIPYRQLQGKTCLLAEANAASRNIVEQYLGVCDMTVIVCVNGRQCLDTLTARREAGQPVDAVLVSHRLPDTDGLQLAHAIHTLCGEDTPRMVLMSTTSFIKAQLRRAGISATLLKPIRQLDLYTRLAGISGRAGSGQRAGLPERTPAVPRLHGLVLLVDDEPINQKIAVAILQKYGVQAEVAGSGAEAVRMAAEKRYSVVLMDIQMPGMSGYEATAAIRQRERTQGLPRSVIIAMTANALEATKRRCLEEGMDDFFTKPIRPDILAERLLPWLQPNASTQDDTGNSQDNDAGQAEDTAIRPLAEKTWNPEKALGFVGGDRSLLRDLATLFFDRHEQMLAKVDEAVGRGDGQALRDAAHAYKGAVSHFASDKLRQLAGSLEHMGKHNEMAAAAETFHLLRAANAGLLAELHSFVGDSSETASNET